MAAIQLESSPGIEVRLHRSLLLILEHHAPKLQISIVDFALGAHDLLSVEPEAIQRLFNRPCAYGIF